MNLQNIQDPRSADDFYKSLKEKLEDHHNFPEDYLYKFIVPSHPEKLTEIYRIFDGVQHTMTNKESKKGNYTALSINAFVLDADMVIEIYKKVAKVEGVVML